MEKEEQYSSPGRAELIRQARASCTQRLDGVPLKSRTVSQNLESTEVNRVPWLKFFLIRLICAVIIFLVIVAIDQMGIKNGYVDSNTIKQQISSNIRVEQLEEYISDFAEDKIIPVFNKKD